MKGLLISAAMFAALSGTAFAQASTDTTAPAATPVNPATSPAPMDTDNTSAAGQAQPTTAPAAPTATPDAAPNNATDTSAAVMQPSGDYPVCKTRGQDHCQVRAQSTHRHATHQSSTTTTAPAPASAPPNG
jgi:hypothetical protein